MELNIHSNVESVLTSPFIECHKESLETLIQRCPTVWQWLLECERTNLEKNLSQRRSSFRDEYVEVGIQLKNSIGR